MQTAWQRLVWFLPQRFTKGLSKAELSSLSWFKPASALIWKYECWCEFEKDLEVFQCSFSETIPIFFIHLSANIVNALHSKVATEFKLKCTGLWGMDFWPVCSLRLPWNFKVLQWINLNESFRHYYTHHEDYLMRFKKNCLKQF